MSSLLFRYLLLRSYICINILYEACITQWLATFQRSRNEFKENSVHKRAQRATRNLYLSNHWPNGQSVDHTNKPGHNFGWPLRSISPTRWVKYWGVCAAALSRAYVTSSSFHSALFCAANRLVLGNCCRSLGTVRRRKGSYICLFRSARLFDCSTSFVTCAGFFCIREAWNVRFKK